MKLREAKRIESKAKTSKYKQMYNKLDIKEEINEAHRQAKARERKP